MDLSIAHTTRSYPRLPYERIAEAVLGSSYELSLVFFGETNAKQLNESARNKSYAPNVLSFPLDDTHGEIYITPAVANREAHKFNHTTRGHIGFLFIHGLLHLKGYDHGTAMEQQEEKLMRQFKLR